MSDLPDTTTTEPDMDKVAACLSFDAYMRDAMVFAPVLDWSRDNKHMWRLTHAMMGLSSEVSEVNQSWILHNSSSPVDLLAELGDVCWFATEAVFSLDSLVPELLSFDDYKNRKGRLCETSKVCGMDQQAVNFMAGRLMSSMRLSVEQCQGIMHKSISHGGCVTGAQACGIYDRVLSILEMVRMMAAQVAGVSNLAVVLSINLTKLRCRHGSLGFNPTRNLRRDSELEERLMLEQYRLFKDSEDRRPG